MFFKNLKISLRHLLKNKGFSTINLFGLTLGFLCFIIIGLYLHDELNFDRMHSDADITYRIIQQEQLENGETRKVASVAARVGPELARQFPSVSEICRLAGFGRLTVGNEPESRGYETLIISDANFFEFFDYTLLQGDPKNCLLAPNSVVISKKLALRYFGTSDALGKILRIDENDMMVSGVMDDFPTNSHLQLDMMFSQAAVDQYFKGYRNFENSDWTSNSFATYLKIKQATVDEMAANITQMVNNNYPTDKEFKSAFSLQQLKDIHLHSEGIEDYQANTGGFNTFYVYTFSAVAFFVLLIAALNYMNLSTAAAYKRTKEIGTRKTMGAGRGSLIGQFLGEALILSLASLMMAVALAQLLLPYINQFANKNLELQTLPNNWLLIIFMMLPATALLAALYPAMVVSQVSPVQAIKKELRMASRAIPVRKTLVAIQFIISIVMISSTLIIYRQLNFIREKELGFNPDNLVTVDINSRILRGRFEPIKAEFAKIPYVQNVAVSSRVPGEWKTFPVASVHNSGQDLEEKMIFVGIDQDFLETYKIQLLNGRNFTSSPADSTGVILSRMAAERLGLQDPIGQNITVSQAIFGEQIRRLDVPFSAQVIGIVEDFHFESIKKEMMPVIFAYHNNPIHNIDYYTLRVDMRHWNETLSEIRNVNSSFDPVNPVEYNFLDDRIGEFYKADDKRGKTFLLFSGVIVIISCLGLFALVSFAIENRRKEIGVRKVLGASIQSIVSLLVFEFLSLIAIAFVIATPLVVLSMRNWLTEFAYHIEINAGIFMMAAAITLLIALATIGFRSLRAALANPVESLRSE